MGWIKANKLELTSNKIIPIYPQDYPTEVAGSEDRELDR